MRNTRIAVRAMRTVGCVAAAATVCSMPALGQETSGKQDEGKLEEVMVTARRQSERIQDVPISITALSQETLEKNNIQTFEQVQFQVPAVSVQTASVSRDLLQFTIRGQGAITLGAQAGVAVYQNEVPVLTGGDGYIPGGAGFFYDLENLQVLKGPQGTLFGKNTTGGAVLLQTARPQNEFAGYAQAGYGNYNNRELGAMLNVPIVDDKVLLRVAVNGQWRDGITQVLNGPAIDDRNSTSARASLLLRPLDGFENLTVASHQRYRSRGSSIFMLGLADNGALATFVPALKADFALQKQLGPRVHIPASVNFDGVGSELTSVTNTSRLELTENTAIRAILGYQRLYADIANYENDGSSLKIFDVLAGASRIQNFTEELQLQGKQFNKKLDYTLGAFHSSTRNVDNQPNGFGHYSRLIRDFTDLFGVQLTDYRQTNFESTGIYGQGSYELFDGFKFTAGTRYTWDDQTSFTTSAPGAPVDVQPSKSQALTYNLGADYKLTPDVLTYLGVRRGYRPGGDARLVNNTFFAFGPEYVTDYELGLKSNWRAVGLSGLLNVALWKQDYSDIQLNRAITVDVNGTPVGTNVTDNAGEAKLWGFDIESSVNLTDRLTVGGFYSHLNFKFGQFKPGVDTTQLIGNEYIGRVPNMWQINANYRLPFPQRVGDISVGANYSWHDESRGFVFGSPAFIVPAVGLVNMNLEWRNAMSNPLDLSVYVSNLANKTYVSGGESYLNLDKGTYGDPRFYGFRVKYHFGGR